MSHHDNDKHDNDAGNHETVHLDTVAVHLAHLKTG